MFAFCNFSHINLVYLISLLESVSVVELFMQRTKLNKKLIVKVSAIFINHIKHEN